MSITDLFQKEDRAYTILAQVTVIQQKGLSSDSANKHSSVPGMKRSMNHGDCTEGTTDTPFSQDGET